METRASYLVVGSFTLALIIGLVTAIVWLAAVGFDEDRAYYDILFDTAVTGLRPGNAVHYRGVPVGVVTDMRIDPDDVERIRVTIELPGSVPVREDTVAELEMQGLTGVAIVQLAGGTNESPPLRAALGERPVIQSKPSQLQELFSAAPDLINRITGLVERATHLLDERNQENLAATLENIATVSGTFAEGSGDVRTLLADAAVAVGDLKATAAETRALLGTLGGRMDKLTLEAEHAMGDARATLQSFGKLSDTLGSEVGGMGPEARATLAELRRAAANLAESQAELAAMIEENREPLVGFTSSGLFEFTQFLSESRTLVSALSRIAAQLERDPARFLFGDQQRGIGLQ